jgi:hypothetical protein
MAKDKAIRKFDVQPVENGDGELRALKIQPTVRWTRESANGKTLDYGSTEDEGEPLIVPIHKVADLVRELTDWPIWYATGKDG